MSTTQRRIGQRKPSPDLRTVETPVRDLTAAARHISKIKSQLVELESRSTTEKRVRVFATRFLDHATDPKNRTLDSERHLNSLCEILWDMVAETQLRLEKAEGKLSRLKQR